MKPGKHQGSKQRCQADLCWKVHDRAQSCFALIHLSPLLTMLRPWYFPFNEKFQKYRNAGELELKLWGTNFRIILAFPGKLFSFLISPETVETFR